MAIEYYGSPRWSGEIADCSMPMTFDTYSRCSYNCLYCFSAYQRDLGNAGVNYRRKEARPVNVAKVKKMFTDLPSSQFGSFIALKRPMQWGGLSDQFDEFERRQGVSLELLRFFREIEYPICFSTKAAWWTTDRRYIECFEGFPYFNVKFSIITLDEAKAHKIEKGCPTPRERLDALEAAARFAGGGVTLRLRPYMFGVSDDTYLALIREAWNRGATALSTEFFCLESRSPGGKETRYPEMSKVAGFDVQEFYRKYSANRSGYLRLNRNIKRPVVDKMQALCAELGMRFYVSDAHFKERCANGSCCGLPESWNYTRGQFCQALILARKQGQVTWAEIESDMEYAKGFLWDKASGYNCNSCEKRAKFYGFTMYDYLHYLWNHPKQGQGPYRLFEGVLVPTAKDTEGNLIYTFDESRS